MRASYRTSSGLYHQLGRPLLLILYIRTDLDPRQRPGPNNDKLQAFPEGFRMIAGDAMKRNFTGGFDAQAVQFVCLGLPASDPNAQINKLPDVNCADGLRVQVYFPSCWDGVNLDSPDHKSHSKSRFLHNTCPFALVKGRLSAIFVPGCMRGRMTLSSWLPQIIRKHAKQQGKRTDKHRIVAYPESGSYDNGPCPASHPFHLISIFFEVIYDINSFASQWTPGQGQHPWVFAQGDPTGYG